MIILAEALNFGEQIGVYLIQTDQKASNELEKLFLFVLSVISFLNLLNSFLPSRRVRVVGSAFIDLAEMIVYLFLFKPTPALIAVTVPLATLEIMCHALNYYFSDPPKTKVRCYERFKEVGIEFVAYLSVNTLPFMTIFIADRSPFRELYFEILLIVFVFFGSSLPLMLAAMISATEFRKWCHTKKIMLSPQSDEEDVTFMRRKPFLLKCWMYVKFLIALLVNFFAMPIALFAISVLQLRKNLNNLPEYDQVVYKLFTCLLVVYAIAALVLIPYLIFFLCQLCRYELTKRRMVLVSAVDNFFVFGAKQASSGYVGNKKFNVF